MIEADRLIAADNPVFREEEVIDRAIRPKKLDDYRGQDHVRSQMEIFSEVFFVFLLFYRCCSS